MKLLVHTQNSAYQLDTSEKTWERLERTDESGFLRTEGGPYDQLLNPPTPGMRLIIICPPITPGAVMRAVSTSPVTYVEELDA